MNTQTIIAQHMKAIKALELIEKANTIIASSEKYVQSTKPSLQPVIEHHRKNVVHYAKVADRLQSYYINLKYRISTTSASVAYTSDYALPF